MNDPIQEMVEAIEAVAKSTAELDPAKFRAWANETNFDCWFRGIVEDEEDTRREVGGFDVHSEAEDEGKFTCCYCGGAIDDGARCPCPDRQKFA